ncbi:MAG: polyprenyl synthetase family protein [Armatimonadetes bacterium]|nr:polyprenyl synthetase family protein [Armatimonadota bacterium]
MSASAFLDRLGASIDEDLMADLADTALAVESVLSQQMRSDVPLAEKIGRLTLEAGGKRMRPALVALSAHATGRPFDRSRAVQLGACMEMVHMATLVHDDVIDEAATRRGVPTAAHAHGNTASVLSGDALLARAMVLLADDGDLQVIRLVSRAVVEMAEGEVREVASRGVFHLGLDEHLAILRMKTAAFIEACCRVGAMVAGAPQSEQDALGQFGHHVGMAFQVMDDMLDYQGDPAKTGKPRATDFREGCATWPLIDLSGTEDLSPWAAVFGNGVTDDQITSLVERMELAGSFRRVLHAAADDVRNAKQALSALPESAARETLAGVADFVLERQA